MSDELEDAGERRPYAGCFRALVIAWSSGALVTAAAHWMSLTSLTGQVLGGISLASGFIAFLAMTPGFIIERRDWGRENAATLSIGFFAALLIRLGCTVALMAFGRYQMRSMQEVIAGWIIAWYVYLTAVEVVALVTSLTRQECRRQTRHQPAGTSVR